MNVKDVFTKGFLDKQNDDALTDKIIKSVNTGVSPFSLLEDLTAIIHDLSFRLKDLAEKGAPAIIVQQDLSPIVIKQIKTKILELMPIEESAEDNAYSQALADVTDAIDNLK